MLQSAAAPRILKFDDDGLMLWIAHATSPYAIMLDPDDGSERWTSPVLRNIMARARPNALTDRTTFPNGDALDFYSVVPLLTQASLFIVRRNGDVAVLDLQSGDLISDFPIAGEAVLHVAAYPVGIVLAGSGRHTISGDDEPFLAILDDQGSVLHYAPTADDQDVWWITPCGFGTVMYGTTAGIHLYDLINRQPVWSVWDDTGGISLGAHCMGDRVLAVHSREKLLQVPLLRPKSIGQMAIEPYDDQDWDVSRIVMISVDDRDAVIMFEERLVRISRSGKIVGEFENHEERMFQRLLRSRDGFLIVSKFGQEQGPLGPDSRTRRTVHRYRLYSIAPDGRSNHDAELDQERHPFTSAALVNNWLLLSPSWSSEKVTIAVPYPSGT